MLTLSTRSGSIPVFSSLSNRLTQRKTNTRILRRSASQDDNTFRLGLDTSDAPDGRQYLAARPPHKFTTASRAAFTRSGVKGTSRSRAPVASKIALPMAAATMVIEVSPAPVASTIGPVEQHDFDLGNFEAQEQSVIAVPIDRGDLLVVPGDFFAERAAHALQRAAFDLVPQTVGIGDRAAVVRRRRCASR